MSDQPRADLDAYEVATTGKYIGSNKLTIPAMIRNRLWLRRTSDIVQIYVDRRRRSIIIQKKAQIQLSEPEGDLVHEVKVIQDRWLYLPADIRDMLWLEENDMVEYLVDPTGNLRFYLRKAA